MASSHQETVTAALGKASMGPPPLSCGIRTASLPTSRSFPPSFSHNPTTLVLTALGPHFPLLHAPRFRPFYLAQAHLIGHAAAEIHASSRTPPSSLLISMLWAFCDANDLLRSASHWPRYELSQLQALSICLAVAPSPILMPETLGG